MDYAAQAYALVRLEVPKAPIPDSYQGLAVLSAAGMRELDRKAVELGTPVLTLMENAGRAVSERTLDYLREKLSVAPQDARLVVCCGRGSNGGDGLVAARYLKQAGAKVKVFLCPPRRDTEGKGSYAQPVEVNRDKAAAEGVDIIEGADALPKALEECHAVLDALLGTGASGKPAAVVRDMIQAITRSRKPVLALDIPSGIDPDTGYHSGVFITAVKTLTLGYPKKGLLAVHAKKYVGELVVLDIGYPDELKKILTVKEL